MQRVLVTGFEPFRDFITNPSWEAVLLLRQAWPEQVFTHELPVAFKEAHQRLRALLMQHQPHVVLCLGVARGNVFRIETQARKPDALAAEPGSSLLPGHWPWQEMQHALAAVELPQRCSQDAGQYVCESTYWSLLSWREHRHWPEFAGFLHVPSESEELPLARIAQGVDVVLRARLRALAQPAPERLVPLT